MDKQQELSELDNQIEKYRKDYVKLQKKLNVLSHKRKTLVEDMYLQDKETNPEKHDINFWLFEDGSVTGKRYSDRDEFVKGLDLFHSGYYFETEQIRLQLVVMPYGKPMEGQLQGVLAVLPYLKPLKDGFVRFDVLTNDCNYSGIVSILVDKETNLAKITLTRYSVEYDITEFDTIENTIKELWNRYSIEKDEQ